MELRMSLKTETKTCFRFEQRRENGELTTLYLKKADIRAAGIDPAKGIVITVEEAE